MTKRAGVLVAALLAYGVSDMPSAAAQSSGGDGGVTYETVATLEVSTENIFEAQDGTIYVTGNATHNVLRITPDRRVDTFVAVPSMAHVLGIVGTDDRFVLTASERPFRGKPGATGQAQFDFSDVGPAVVVVDRKGVITSTLRGVKGAFFNGIAASTAPGRTDLILIADSNAGTIWRVDVAKQQIEPWLKDQALARENAPTGANGIKIHNGWVYVNSRGTMYRIRIGADGRPQGMLMPLAREVGNDDFDLAKDGTLYILYMSSMKKISPDGEVSTVYENVPTGPASIVSRDGKWLYWPTRVGNGPQRLLRAPLR